MKKVVKINGKLFMVDAQHLIEVTDKYPVHAGAIYQKIDKTQKPLILIQHGLHWTWAYMDTPFKTGFFPWFKTVTELQEHIINEDLVYLCTAKSISFC